MFTNKNRYINLEDASKPVRDVSELKIMTDSRVVKLSGKGWGWVWNRPSGLIIQRGNQRQRVPIFDFTRILQILFYGLSALMVIAGLIKGLNKGKGEAYG